MGVKYWQDTGNHIKSIADTLIKTDFPYLGKVKINYIFREPAQKDPSSRFGVVAGTARSIPSKEFDLYGFHFEICMAAEAWQTATPEQKRRLVWHELRHCMITLDEEGNPITDKEERIKTSIEPHDIFLYGFRNEYEKFGFTEQSDREAAVFLGEILEGSADRGSSGQTAQGQTESGQGWTRYIMWHAWGEGEDEERMGAYTTVRAALKEASRMCNVVEDVEQQRYFKIRWKGEDALPPLITVDGKKKIKWTPIPQN